MLPLVSTVRTSVGIFMGFSHDTIYKRLSSHGIWDPTNIEITKAFLKHNLKNQNVLDLGANLGAYTIPIAQNTKGKVYSFEAQRIIFQQLCGNCFMNRLDNVIAHNVAVVSPKEHGELIQVPLPNYTEEFNIGGISIDPEIRELHKVSTTYSRRNRTETEFVQGITIDSLKISNICLIKIDIEGYEYNALLGCFETLKNSEFPPIIFEAWVVDWYSNFKKRIDNLLYDYGYKNIFQLENSSNFIAQNAKHPFQLQIQPQKKKLQNTPQTKSQSNLIGENKQKLTQFYEYVKRYNRIVLWGYRTEFHTHGFIHLGYYEFLKKMNIPVLWLDNTEESNNFIKSNDLIMIPDAHINYHNHDSKSVKHKFRKDVFYIFHRGENILQDDHSQYEINKSLFLKEHRTPFVFEAEKNDNNDNNKQAWGKYIYFFKHSHLLIQPWGTNLLPWEFYPPIFNNTNEVYFIGSIWGYNNNKNGNILKINELKEIIENKGLKFIHKNRLSTIENIDFIRKSRLSFSIGAVGHNEYDYLQCRMFKNISYGQPTITDVKAFKNILEETFIEGESWAEKLDFMLSLPQGDYLLLAKKQQEKIKNYTYLDMWINIFRALNEYI